MKLFLILLFSLVITSYSVAQRPASNEKIESKIDSILFEANQLYSLLSAKMRSIKSIKIKDIKLIEDSVLAYIQNDTIKVIFLKNPYESSFTDYYSMDSVNLLFHDEEINQLSLFEKELFRIKRKVLTSTDAYSVNKEFPDRYYVSLLLKERSVYKYFLISMTKSENQIPFGGDTLFIIDSVKMDISNPIGFYKHFSIDIANIDGSSNYIFSPCYNNDLGYILSTDMVKFRFYKPHEYYSVMKVFSSLNKRFFWYSPISNFLYFSLFDPPSLIKQELNNLSE